MLRLAFVFLVITLGLLYSFRGPFQMLLFYVWYAYFRPDAWVWDGALIASLNLSLYLGVFLLIATVLFRSENLRVKPLTVLVVVFLLHNLASLLVSPHTGPWSWASFEQFTKSVVIALLMPMLVDDQRKLRTLLLVMGFSLGLEGAKQGWAQLVTNPGAVNANSVPFLGDNNHVAVGMLMLVPVLSALSATAERRWEKHLEQFLIVGVFYRALSTYSRGGFLAAIAMAGVGMLRSKHPARMLLVMGIVAGLVLPVMPSTFWERMSSITTPGQLGVEARTGMDGDVVEDGSVKGRLHFWSVARLMAADHPLTGVGHWNFARAYDDYDTSSGQYGSSRAVHSAWFGILGELGYVGLVLFLLIVWTVFWTARRVRLDTRGRPEHAVLHQAAIMLETSMVVFCVGGSFVTFQYIEMLWHFIGLGIVLSTLHRQLVSTVPEMQPTLLATGTLPGWRQQAAGDI